MTRMAYGTHRLTPMFSSTRLRAWASTSGSRSLARARASLFHTFSFPAMSGRMRIAVRAAPLVYGERKGEPLMFRMPSPER